MRPLVAVVCQRVEMTERSVTLVNLADRFEFREFPARLRFDVYFEVEVPPEIVAPLRKARIELVGPDGSVDGYTTERDLRERPGQGVRSFLLTGQGIDFSQPGPYEVRLVIEESVVAARTISVFQAGD